MGVRDIAASVMMSESDVACKPSEAVHSQQTELWRGTTLILLSKNERTCYCCTYSQRTNLAKKWAQDYSSVLQARI